MKFKVFAYICLSFVLTSALMAQRRGGPDMQAPRPIDAFDSVWIEELTWMEVRDAIKAGKTTVIIPAGSTEQTGRTYRPESTCTS